MSGGEKLPRLIVVEDDARYRELLARALAARGFAVSAAAGVAEARSAIAREAPDFAVVDLKLHDGSGLDLLATIRERAAGARCVVLTGWGSIATALRAVRLGAVDFLAKPVEIDRLVAVLRGGAEPTPAGVEGDEGDAGAAPSLDRVEWEHIQRVLDDCDGNVSRAARALGLHRRSLQRKLRKRPAAR